MTEFETMLRKAIDDRVDGDYVAMRLAKMSEAGGIEMAPDGSVTVIDTTGLRVSGQLAHVARILADHFVSSAPESLRNEGGSSGDSGTNGRGGRLSATLDSYIAKANEINART